MNVTLVRPATVMSRMAHTTPTCPPIGMAYVAASIRRAGHRTAVVDAVGEDMFRYEPWGSYFLVQGLRRDDVLARIPKDTDVLGFSCMFAQQIPLVRDLLREARAAFPRAAFIAGGEHVSAIPEETLQTLPELDAIVVGEGEETAVEILDVLARGGDVARVAGVVARGRDGPVRAEARRRVTAIDDIAEPAWDLTPLPKYLDHEKGFGVNRGRSIPMIATRGCPYRCTFCSSPSMWTTRWIARNPERLLQEMERHIATYAIDNFDFYDLTAIVKREWIVDFCRLILARGHGFTWQLPSGTRSEAIDREVAALLFRSGCRNVSYAPESGSLAVLARIKKKVRLDRMKESMRTAVAAGLNVKANMLFGFPGETRADMWTSLRFTLGLALTGIHDVSVCSFSPYPGSELFDDLRANGRIPRIDDDYSMSLIGYSDLGDTVSWSEHVGGREVALYRLLAGASFYAVSFARRPLRILRLARNLLRRRQESRLEASLRDMARRLWLGLRSRARATSS